MSIFVVAGATGHIGSVVARELLAKGHEVHAVVRSAEKGKELAGLGARLLTGELADASFLTGALRGADGAFLLQPPPPQDTADVRAYQDRIVHAEAEAVAESGIRHVVQLSSWGAERQAGTGPIVGLHHLEEALKKTRAVVSILRAGGFTENILHMLPAAQHAGVFPHFLPAEAKASNIATRDIASVAVRALLAPPAATEVVYVLGAHEYSAVEQAAYLAKKLGKEVKPTHVPVSQVSATMQKQGTSASLADAFQEMYEGMTKGLFGIEPGHRVETGETTLEEAIDPYFAKA
jgi:uncharacterized protein YbjT (DUF2867 family)